MFLYSGRIRTLVAMATYSFHRLIMGREEVDILLSHWRYLNFFSQIYLLSSHPSFVCSMSKSLNLIGCWGDMKGEFSFFQRKSSQKPKGG